MARKTRTDECVPRLKALADQTRLQVLLHLIDAPHTVGELVNRMGIEQSLLSHHLQVLRSVGLVEGVRAGRHVHYRPAKDTRRSSRKSGINLGCCVLDFGAQEGNAT